jgi:hypothetical protein
MKKILARIVIACSLAAIATSCALPWLVQPPKAAETLSRDMFRGTLCQEEIAGGLCFGDRLKPFVIAINLEPALPERGWTPLIDKTELEFKPGFELSLGYGVSLGNVWGMRFDRTGLYVPTPIDDVFITGNSSASFNWSTGSLEIKKVSGAIAWYIEDLVVVRVGYEERGDPIEEWRVGLSIESKL